MSAETFEAVVEALRAHMADEMEGMHLTEWVALLTGEAIDRPSVNSYLTVRSRSTPHALIGLADMLTDRVVADFTERDE